MRDGDYVLVLAGPGQGRVGAIASIPPAGEDGHLISLYGCPESTNHYYAASDLLPVPRSPCGGPDLAGLVLRLSAALAETRMRAERAETEAAILSAVLRARGREDQHG
jgi:hypothetical protein